MGGIQTGTEKQVRGLRKKVPGKPPGAEKKLGR